MTSLRRHRADLLAALAVVALSFVVVALHIERYQVLAPSDETEHVDYVYRLRDGELPRYGETLTDRALEDLRCRGSDNATEVTPPDCDRALPPLDELPAQGHAYEAGQQPLYYLVTAAIDGAVGATDVGWGRVGVMRASGALWLAAGGLALYAALRWLGRGRGLSLAATAVLVASPAVVFAASTVSNDIATWFVGCVGLLAVVACVRRWFPAGAWGAAALALGAVGLLAGLTKTTTLIAMVLVSGALLLVIWARRPPAVARAVAVALVPTAACAATIGLWGLVVLARQLAPTEELLPFALHQADGLDLGTAVTRFWFMIPPVVPQHLPPFATHLAALDWAMSVSKAVQLAVLALPLLVRPTTVGPTAVGPADRAIGTSTALTFLLTSPYYVVLLWVSTNEDLAGQVRFVFPLLPFFVVLVTGWVPSGWRRWSAVAALGLPSVVVLWLLVTGGHPSPAG